MRKAIPYLNKPEEIDPSIANFYASTYFTGADYNAVLVKNRDGRPIKLEGNPESPITRGGLSARAQAAVLSLYDGGRLQHFAIKGAQADKDRVDQEIRTKLASTNGPIAIVSPTIISPSTKRAIAEFAGRYANVQHVMYDSQSVDGLLQAYNGTLPSYDFSRARVIVSLAADFLGTWVSPVEFAKQYATTRKVSSESRQMSRHYQFETAMSTTGANADVRVPVKPSDLNTVALDLYNAVNGADSTNNKSAYAVRLAQAAADLRANRGGQPRGIGLERPGRAGRGSGHQREPRQRGQHPLTWPTPATCGRANDARMMALVNQIIGGGVGAVIFYHANPVFNHPMGEKLGKALKNVPLTISFNDRLDETGSL